MIDTAPERSITLAVLAGGEGSRMGFPKAAIIIDGEPILIHLMRRLAWPGPTVLVTAPGREHPAGAASFDREVTDPVSGEGPLRGVLTALEHSQTDVTIVATVDMPSIGSAQLIHLAQQLRDLAAMESIMLRRPASPEDRIEPFPSIYRRTFDATIRAQLQSGERSMQALSRHERVELLTAPPDWPPMVWTNLNRPSDVQAYHQLPVRSAANQGA
jgi:molybdopterin-guanine dinucleotide biosynthesis protein A